MPDGSSSFSWSEQRVLVTGGAGFLGSFVVEKLKERGCSSIAIPRSKEFDLRQASAISRLLDQSKPTLIIHLAATCGGIGANKNNPGKFFYDNAMMGIELIEQTRHLKSLQKFVQVGTVCAYPIKPKKIPFVEEELWEGYPEPTNAPYGVAKKMLLVQLQAYREQYELNGIFLLPANMYGPHDHFDLLNSHVVPALIRKFFEAKKAGAPTVTLWGTGKASRDFFYVEDAAEGILLAAERYNKPEPINLGTGVEVRIKELAEMIQKIVGYSGKIVWDSSKPDGQPRRCLSVDKAKKEFGFTAQTSIEKGLQKTIAWYLDQNSSAAVR